MTEKALGGLKVLEYGQMISGPYCAKLLADLGAEVIKVEPPGTGDQSRRLGPFADDIPDPEKSGLFLCLNTNKLGITLNLDTTTGIDIFKELVKGVDIVVENNQPQYMERLGLDYPSLRQVNPTLIMTSISPFGQTGPSREYKAYDINIMAAGGLAYVTGYPDREPLLVASSQSGYEAALNAAVGTLIALNARETTGLGQQVDISEQESVASILGDVISYYTYLDTVRRRAKRGETRRPDDPDPLTWPRGIYSCKDGYISPLTLEVHQWRNFVELLGNPEWAMDARLDDQAYRGEHAVELDSKLTDALKERTREDLYRAGQARRIPIAPVNDMEAVCNSPELNARDFFVEVEHPMAGRLSYPGPPYKLNETPWSLDRPAPLLGQHNEEIYCNRMRFTKTDLVKMYEAHII